MFVTILEEHVSVSFSRVNEGNPAPFVVKISSSVFRMYLMTLLFSRSILLRSELVCVCLNDLISHTPSKLGFVFV